MEQIPTFEISDDTELQEAKDLVQLFKDQIVEFNMQIEIRQSAILSYENHILEYESKNQD